MSADHGFASVEWMKSSYSSSSGGDCLEFSRSLVASVQPKLSYRVQNGGGFARHRIAGGRELPELPHTPLRTDRVPVRDSKNPAGPILVFQAPGWASFVAALKTGRLSGS